MNKVMSPLLSGYETIRLMLLKIKQRKAIEMTKPTSSGIKHAEEQVKFLVAELLPKQENC